MHGDCSFDTLANSETIFAQPTTMNRFPLTKLLVVLAMLLSIAGGPVVASSGRFATSAKVCAMKQCCCHGPACCAMKAKQPAEQQPAPVQHRVGQDLAAAVAAAPFSLLFTFGPTEAKRAPRASFADWHAPGPLAASCIRLI